MRRVERPANAYPAKGTLEEQLARAFPEIPKWTRVLNDDGEWYHARITYKSGDACMISWEDGVDPDEYRVGYELREP